MERGPQTGSIDKRILARQRPRVVCEGVDEQLKRWRSGLHNFQARPRRLDLALHLLDADRPVN